MTIDMEWQNFITDYRVNHPKVEDPHYEPEREVLANGMEIVLRLEEPSDWREVEELTRAAFWQKERMQKCGIGCDEHYLVHTLRSAAEFAPELDIVALYEGKIVGNVMFTLSYVKDISGKFHPTLIFGPLSVLPGYQRMGIGSAIMLLAIRFAAKYGHGAILLYGHPEYYPKLGFVEAKEFGITTADGKNFPAFMAMELVPGYLSEIGGGTFHYSPLIDLDIEKAKEYNKRF